MSPGIFVLEEVSAATKLSEVDVSLQQRAWMLGAAGTGRNRRGAEAELGVGGGTGARASGCFFLGSAVHAVPRCTAQRSGELQQQSPDETSGLALFQTSSELSSAAGESCAALSVAILAHKAFSAEQRHARHHVRRFLS